jgi:hypothetical protein
MTVRGSPADSAARAGSLGAMSEGSGEPISAVVRQLLSARGPTTEDDLLGVGRRRPSERLDLIRSVGDVLGP